MNKKLIKYHVILIIFSLFILKNNIASAQLFNPYSGKAESSDSLNNHGIFKFDNSINASDIVDAFFPAPSNVILKPYFLAAIENYENKTLNSAWKNNLAGAIAVFAPLATKIYHNIEIPPDFSEEEYFNSLNNSFHQQPNASSDRDKQITYYLLIGWSGVLARMELEAKHSNQIIHHQAVRELAGNKIQEYLHLNPQNIFFGNKTLLTTQPQYREGLNSNNNANQNQSNQLIDYYKKQNSHMNSIFDTQRQIINNNR